MKTFLSYFKYVNDKHELVLIWSHAKNTWCYATQSELYSKMRYVDFWGGKSSLDTLMEDVVYLRYNRRIKSTPSNTPQYNHAIGNFYSEPYTLC